MKSVLCAMILSLAIACGAEKKPCVDPVPDNDPSVTKPTDPNVAQQPVPEAEIDINTFEVVVAPPDSKGYGLFVIDQAEQYGAELFRMKELQESPEYSEVLSLKLNDGSIVDVLEIDGRHEPDFFSANLCQGEFSKNCRATVIVQKKRMKWLRIVVPIAQGHAVYMVPPQQNNPIR